MIQLSDFLTDYCIDILNTMKNSDSSLLRDITLWDVICYAYIDNIGKLPSIDEECISKDILEKLFDTKLSFTDIAKVLNLSKRKLRDLMEVYGIYGHGG